MRLTEIWGKPTSEILQEAGLSKGMSCLDVGCGSGEVMRLMGELVGPAGKVAGLDIDGKIGREAVAELKATGNSNFEFVEGDMEKLDNVSNEKYDLTYARFLLSHIDDPISALRKMFEWTKPRGCIVIQDYDFRTIDVYPPTEITEEFKSVFFGVHERARRDLKIGHKIPHYFLQAGLGSPERIHVQGLIQTVAEASGMIQSVYQSVLPFAVKSGVTTEEKGRSFVQRLKDLPTKESCYILWPLYVGAWKRKSV